MPVCTYTEYKGSVLEERAQTGLHSICLSFATARCVNNWKQPRNTMCSEEAGQTQIEMLRAASSTVEEVNAKLGDFHKNRSPLGRNQKLHLRPDAAQRKKLLEPEGSSLQELRKGRISQAPPAVQALRKPPATCVAGHGCAQSSEQIAAGPVHTGHRGTSNKGVKRGLWYGVSRDCRPLWSPQHL